MRHKLMLKYESCAPNNHVDLPIYSRQSGTPFDYLKGAWIHFSKTLITREELFIGLKSHSKRKFRTLLANNVIIREISETSRQSFRFTFFVTALRIVTENVKLKSTTTNRDLYYRDVNAFLGSQYNLNHALELISSSFRLSITGDLYVFPSPKGIFWGGPRQTLSFGDNKFLDLSYSKEYFLIPYISECSKLTLKERPKAILVFEKEAVFRSFIEYVRSNPAEVNLLVICGKGFPDLASKRMLYKLKQSLWDIPTLFFVDSDIYGMRICWTYLQLLQEFTENVFLAGVFINEYSVGHLSMEDKERRLIRAFLFEMRESRQVESCLQKLNFRIHRELTRCLMLGKKAEMNVVSTDDRAHGLNAYIWSKVNTYASR